MFWPSTFLLCFGPGPRHSNSFHKGSQRHETWWPENTWKRLEFFAEENHRVRAWGLVLGFCLRVRGVVQGARVRPQEFRTQEFRVQGHFGNFGNSGMFVTLVTKNPGFSPMFWPSTFCCCVLGQAHALAFPSTQAPKNMVARKYLETSRIVAEGNHRVRARGLVLGFRLRVRGVVQGARV